jgi:hypothetical protein
MAFPKKWDWEAIRLEYIAGEIIIDEFGNETRRHLSIKKLGERHEIPHGTIQKKCYEEKWIRDRNILDLQLKRKVTEDKVTQIFGESVISSSYTLKQLAKINTIVDAYLQPYLDSVNPDKHKSVTVQTTISEDGYSNLEVLGDSEEKKISPREIKDLVSVIKEVHVLKQSILGDEKLHLAVEDIKTKDKAKSISKLKGTTGIENKLQQLLSERQKVQAKLRDTELEEVLYDDDD